MKGKVYRNAEQQLKMFRQSGAWLNTAVNFDHCLLITEEQQKQLLPLFQSCQISSRKENLLNFSVLLGNLLFLFEHKKQRPIRINLSPYSWKKTRYGRAGASTINIIKKLHEGGYLKMKKGYYTKNESRLTRIWPSEKLLKCFRELPQGVIYKPVELVELRDEKGNSKDYRDTSRTRKIRAILKQANGVNSKADIRFLSYKLQGDLVAIFKPRFTMYGRLHTRGYMHYQGFSGEERAEITINGDPIVELDYSGLHPHLLYAKEGIQFTGDPYSCIDDRPEVRPFLKHILLCMLNAKDKTAAEKAANYWLFRKHSEREKLKEIGITRAAPLMDRLQEKHKTIAHYLCNGNKTGLRIMNLDATIALDIIHHFAKQRIPILAIHDSFIVQEQFRDELFEVMGRIYRKHTGFNIPIK